MMEAQNQSTFLSLCCYLNEKEQQLDQRQYELLKEHLVGHHLQPYQQLPTSKHKLCILLSDSVVLQSKMSREVCGQPNKQKVQEFQAKFGSLRQNRERDYLQKRIEIMYGDYEVVKENKGQYVHAQADFYEETSCSLGQIVLATKRCQYLTLDRTHLPRQLYVRLQQLFKNKIHYLRSFPALGSLQKNVFDLHLSEFRFRKCHFDNVLYGPGKGTDTLFLLKAGEVQISHEKIKLFRMTGEQMIGECRQEGETATVVSCAALVYEVNVEIWKMLAQTNLFQVEQGKSNYHKNLIFFKKKQKQRILDNKARLEGTEANLHEFSDIQQATANKSLTGDIFTMQFNMRVDQVAQKKQALLNRLMPRGQNSIVMYQPREIIRKMPDMSVLHQRYESKLRKQYNRIRQQRADQNIVDTYKLLVRNGLELPLSSSHRNLSTRQKLQKINMTKSQKMFSLMDVLKKCR